MSAADFICTEIRSRKIPPHGRYRTRVFSDERRQGNSLKPLRCTLSKYPCGSKFQNIKMETLVGKWKAFKHAPAPNWPIALLPSPVLQWDRWKIVLTAPEKLTSLPAGANPWGTEQKNCILNTRLFWSNAENGRERHIKYLQQIPSRIWKQIQHNVKDLKHIVKGGLISAVRFLGNSRYLRTSEYSSHSKSDGTTLWTI